LIKKAARFGGPFLIKIAGHQLACERNFFLGLRSQLQITPGIMVAITGAIVKQHRQL
jgi:hypothetical protein